MNRPVVILMMLLTGFTCGAVMANANTGDTLHTKENGKGSYAHITTDDSVRRIVDHPAFKAFSQLISMVWRCADRM